MTTKLNYCTADEVRRLLGLTSTDIADADVVALITWAEAEVDKITNTTYIVAHASGTATAGAATSITDSGAAWTVDEWNADDNLVSGYAVWVYSGTGSGQCRTITDNTATVLTVSPAWATNPDNTSKYRIIKNTYRDETFDGDGSDSYFVENYPVLAFQSLTIDSTTVTLATGYGYTYLKTGQIILGDSAQVTYFRDEDPQLCNVKYHYGIYPVPDIIKKLTATIAALTCAEYMIGNTYTFATNYSIPELSVNKGVPYPHFDKLTAQLMKRIELYKKELQAIIVPAVG